MRYRERFHLSYEDFLKEPAAEVERALFIWELDAKRGKLEAERSARNT